MKNNEKYINRSFDTKKITVSVVDTQHKEKGIFPETFIYTGKTDKFQKYLGQIKPDYVLISVDSEEIETAMYRMTEKTFCAMSFSNPEKREKNVDYVSKTCVFTKTRVLCANPDTRSWEEFDVFGTGKRREDITLSDICDDFFRINKNNKNADGFIPLKIINIQMTETIQYLSTEDFIKFGEFVEIVKK